MDSLISLKKTTFIKGRQLVDSVMALNEVVNLAKVSKKECFIFKVDFEKSYDSVSWSFLDSMLVRFMFNVKWRAWIRACIFSGDLSVLVNGCLADEICIQGVLSVGTL